MDAQVLSTAQPSPEADQAARPTRQHLTFLLRQELFAIPLLEIKEIVDFQRVTPVPMMPDWVRGIMNLRGTVLPIIDLQTRLHGAQDNANRRRCIIVAEHEQDDGARDIGVIVDEVSQVIDWAPSEIDTAPQFGMTIPSSFIRGVARSDEAFVILLNTETVLAIEDGPAMSDHGGGEPLHTAPGSTKHRS